MKTCPTCQQDVKEPVTHRCEGCGVDLKLVFPEHAHPESTQYENALEIEFSGGYAMFIDPYPQSTSKIWLCHECAHASCEALPWLNKLIDPPHSHSHTQEFWDTHPEHEGWDKHLQEGAPDAVE